MAAGVSRAGRGASGEVEDYFEHYTEERVGYDPAPSAFPSETREALKGILESPLGSEITQSVGKSGQKIKLATALNADQAFQVGSDDVIYYTLDVPGYIRSISGISGDGLDTATLGTLLSHEIGHLALPVSGLTYRQEEIFVSRYFENIFRQYKGMAQRCSYFVVNDVCN